VDLSYVKMPLLVSTRRTCARRSGRAVQAVARGTMDVGPRVERWSAMWRSVAARRHLAWT
jgi:hypothetical protein